MTNLNGFNATEVEPTTSFEPIPAGKYLSAITESEMKPTKNGSGRCQRSEQKTTIRLVLKTITKEELGDGN